MSDISMERQGFYKEGIRGKHRMVRTNKWKLIMIPREGGNLFELYDLESDPKEIRNLAAIEKDVCNFFKKKLSNWIKKDSAKPVIDKSILDSKTKEELKSLGYLQ